MSKQRKYFLYFTVFVTGAVVLVIEILGTRILAPFFGATIFVWTSLITITLGALALGYFVGGKAIDKKPEPRILFSTILAAAFFVFLIMKIDQWALIMSDSLGLKWGPLLSAAILFAVPLFLLGMAGPMVIRLTSDDISHSGSSAGKVFAVSTIGSIIGGILAGFILIPRFSLTEILNSSAIILAILTLVGLILFQFKNRQMQRDVAVLVLIIIGFGLFLPKYQYTDKYSFNVLHQEATHYSDLKVLEVGFTRCLAMDGALQSCILTTTNKPSFSFIGEIHRLVGERNPKNFLLMGVGAGNVLEDFPGETKITAVELDPRTIEMGKQYFNLKDDQYEKLVISDARYFLRQNQEDFDMIFYDMAVGNVFPSHLFSREAFETVKEDLSDDGLFLLHLQGGFGREDKQVGAVVKTLKEVFPTVFLTATELEQYTTIIVHASSDLNYTFENTGSRLREVPINWQEEVILTDNQNPFELVSLDKLSIFLDEMKNFGGFRMLFTS